MRKITFMNGSSVSVYDFVSAKTSFQMKPLELAALKNRLTNSPVDCVNRRDVQIIDRQTLFGQQFVVQQHSVHLKGQTFPGVPAGTLAEESRLTEWLAPQLGCERLGYRLEAKQLDGSYRLITEARLISLEMKEPEPAFFDPAANFEELLPSEIWRRHYQKIGQPEPKEMEEQGKKADQYHKDHPVAP